MATKKKKAGAAAAAAGAGGANPAAARAAGAPAKPPRPCGTCDPTLPYSVAVQGKGWRWQADQRHVLHREIQKLGRCL